MTDNKETELSEGQKDLIAEREHRFYVAKQRRVVEKELLTLLEKLPKMYSVSNAALYEQKNKAAQILVDYLKFVENQKQNAVYIPRGTTA